MHELIKISATRIINNIKNKKVSCEEVMLAYLAQIEKVNPKLNAIVQQLDPEQAWLQARQAD